MKVRRAKEVWHYREDFGGVVYVHRRNDFFFFDKPAFELFNSLSSSWRTCARTKVGIYRRLAQIGVCETTSPSVKETHYSGPSFIGEFPDMPAVSRPLVLNCFATAFCPLNCKYCHADDLMKPFRSTERVEQLDAVITTANNVNSMVVVISGGDPLTRVDRAIRLIEGIEGRPIVIDTSGVPSNPGDLDRLIPVLVKHRVHVRVSIDGFKNDNDRVRPVIRHKGASPRSSYDEATRTLRLLMKAKLNVTVQTVLSTQNDRADNLIQFAQLIESWGVRNWVIHIATEAGKAREQIGRPIIPSKSWIPVLKSLFERVKAEELKLDVRVTNANKFRNAVFLVGSEGDLYTEGFESPGKVLIFDRRSTRSPSELWKHVNPQAHSARYSNWLKELYPEKSISDVSIRLSELQR